MAVRATLSLKGRIAGGNRGVKGLYLGTTLKKAVLTSGKAVNFEVVVGVQMTAVSPVICASSDWSVDLSEPGPPLGSNGASKASKLAHHPPTTA